MFELYHSLETQVKTCGKIDLYKLRDNILKLDIEGHTFIFALIYYFNISESRTLPPQISEKFTFDLSTLSEKLQKILHKFTQMHLQKMKEATEMQKAAKVARLETILHR